MFVCLETKWQRVCLLEGTVLFWDIRGAPCSYITVTSLCQVCQVIFLFLKHRGENIRLWQVKQRQESQEFCCVLTQSCAAVWAVLRSELYCSQLYPWTFWSKRSSHSVMSNSLQHHGAAPEAPLSMGSSRQGYWSGLPFPPPQDLPHPGTEPTSFVSPALAGKFFTISATCKAPSGYKRQWILFLLEFIWVGFLSLTTKQPD